MNLVQLINATSAALAAATASDWDACAAALNAPSIEKKDDTRRTSLFLTTELTTTEANLVLGTLQASNVPVIRQALLSLGTGGIDLSHPVSQAMIDLLAQGGGWPDALRDKIKAYGIWHVSPAADAGLDAPDAATCQAAWARVATRAKVDSAYDALLNEIYSNPTADNARLIEVFTVAL